MLSKIYLDRAFINNNSFLDKKFEKSHKLFEEGAFFEGRYNETIEVAKITTTTIPKLLLGQYSAIVSGALNRFDFDPPI